MNAADRTRLRADVALAGRIIAPSWPLETFIAVNPLGGLEDQPFEEAIGTAARVLGARGTLDEDAFRVAYAGGRVTDADLLGALDRRGGGLLNEEPFGLGGRSVTAAELWLTDFLHGEPAPAPARRQRTLSERITPAVADAVDAQTARWCGAFLDAGQAAWGMPGRERGLYAAWRDLAPRDGWLPRAARGRLADWPERPEDAVLGALALLGVPTAERVSYLQAHLACQPGWAGHVRWRSEHRGDADLVDLLGIRLAYEAVLLDARWTSDVAPEPRAPAPTPDDRAARVAAALGVQARADELAVAAAVLARLEVDERRMVWLDAYEGGFRNGLLAGIARQRTEAATERPAAQLVCCIDVRSEGLRRHLEQSRPYETLGFAGFFAVAIRFQDLAGGRPSALCPVLLAPRNAVRERPAEGWELLASRAVGGRHALGGAEEGFHAAKDDVVGPFALAEAAGWAAGPVAAAKTLAAGPYGALREHLHRRAVPPVPTTLSVEEAFPLDERALLAEATLTMMGLTRGFGRLVVLCGHGSTTENNPYGAALDCGACGGNRGGPNARTAAAVLNGADVREHLATRGIDVPADTWFVAAEHDTATDEVVLLDRHLVPAGHQPDLDRLAADLDRAGERLSAERCLDLPGATATDAARARRHVRARSADWAQVFPEWGLAGNAAFVVGPRALTKGLELGRRAFLHSYDAAVDADGAALETILTAPLVVAQWINCQYYFSTVDPVVFGAGTKTVHNVVGGVGVLAGHGGDLQTGLPWQSVADGDRLVHEPMRLLAIVEAPLERIDAIVARNTVLQRLFGGGWVALAARERPEEGWCRHTDDGWVPWSEEEVAAR